MRIRLKIWRQVSSETKGGLKLYTLDQVNPDMSFLEMLDVLNDSLERDGKDPVAFDHDCREGICGMCSLVINGRPHGGQTGTTTCQLHMRHFKNGDTIVVEPWRAKSFPVIKDLIVDRSAFDRILQKGGYISVKTGAAPDANVIAVPKKNAEAAFDAAACIGCGACVSACKNASAILFVSAKAIQLSLLPQGQPERRSRVLKMVGQMDREGFGNCTNESECEAACPKEISVSHIARINREYLKASILGE